MLAPVTILLCWFTGASILIPLLVCALIAPLLFAFIMTSLRGNNSPVRWWLMQFFGIGAVLMTIIPLTAPLTLMLSTPLVAGIALALWLGFSFFAIRRAHDIHNTTLTINSPRINNPLRIVQISDVHIGSRRAAFLEHVVNQVNSHNPDLVVITGDLLDSSSVSRDDLAALSTLSAESYMCLGNHERYVDLARAIESIEHHGVTLLRNEAVHTQAVQLIGIDDFDKPDDVGLHLEAMDIDHDRFRILLYHKPDGWPAAVKHGVELTLAGHTHAGQIWPFGHLVKRQYPEMAGLFDRASSMLYVSTGTGTWGPTLRFGTRSEMTVINLEPSAESS